MLIVVLAILCGLCLIPAAATPPSGYYEVWGDEFNGTALDTNKWDYWENNKTWGKAYNTASAVSVNNGHLVITTLTSGGTNFTAMVASDFHFRPRYGYYEASIKWGDYSGMWSAFWLRSPTMGTYLDDAFVSGAEIDVCEHRYVGIYGTNIANIVSDNIHWNGYGSQETSSGSPNVGTGLGTGFHTYGLLWSLNNYSFSIDGSEAWNGASTTPPFGSGVYMILSSQVDDGTDVGNPPWAGYIPSGGYPTGTNQLVVDYFRYYAPTNVLFWTGANSPYWTNAANWVSNFVPLASSDLTFSYLSTALSNVLGSNYAVDGLVFLGTTGTASINGTNTLTLGAGGVDMVAADHNVTLSAPISLSAGQKWIMGRNSPGNVLNLNGPLSGTVTLTKAGYGTLALNGTNSFSGALNVDTGGSTNDGKLLIARSQAVAYVASPIAIRNSGTGVSTLQLSNSVTIPQTISLAGRGTNVAAIEALSGANALPGGLSLAGGGLNYLVQCDSAGTLALSGPVSAGSTATGARTLTLQGAGNFVVSGPIQNGSASPLSLVKTNNGTLTLSGTNTFTGVTTNWGGNLFVLGTLAGPLVFNGGTLSGTGYVGGDAAVQGGELSPGTAVANSIGTLSFGGNLTLGAYIQTVMEINAALQTNDQLNVAGTLTCGGMLYVGTLGGTLAAGQTYRLFNAAAYAGSFPTLSLPSLDPGLAWDTSQLFTDGTIAVAALPSAAISPAATNAECASTVLLTAIPGGTPPFTYQWLDAGSNPIAGATTATLNLPDVTSAQAGTYTVLVTNSVGSSTATASLSVTDTTPPVITWSFTNLTLNADTNNQALMPDVTGLSYIRAFDACSPILIITQTPLSNTVLALGTHPVVLAVADTSGNTSYSSNTVAVIRTHSAPGTLSITDLGGGDLQLNWDTGILQGATDAAGPFGDVPNAIPPFTVPATNSQQFYRLR
ncbi:MAG TPA: family 16 glycosylhydrolase [Candidatus Acidoferrum sp.]|nr:family 16 glycosylhydrolase [Candidatus Acidoferrum sp.]